MNLPCILLVEDDPNDVFFFRHALMQAGSEVDLRVASDGQEAIDYLSGVSKYADREAFPAPMLTLMDLKLPRVMGLDVLEWIRRTPGVNRTVVVILTSSAEASDIARAYDLHVNAYAVKPNGIKALTHLVECMKTFWIEHNRAPSSVLIARVECGTRKD
jgi:CheY-like chemotaxis protein